jgi:hypothetical protein
MESALMLCPTQALSINVAQHIPKSGSLTTIRNHPGRIFYTYIQIQGL